MKNLTKKQENLLKDLHQKMVESFNRNPSELARQMFIYKTEQGIPVEVFLEVKWKRFCDSIFEKAKIRIEKYEKSPDIRLVRT